MASLRDYYELTKARLVLGNAIAALAGFILASNSPFNTRLLLETLAGIMFVMASGCVFNNYIDRAIDREMERTKSRALATGRMSGGTALFYGAALGVAGFLILIFFTNILTVGAALFGFFFYVVMYSLWWKRISALGMFVGGLAGAVPPVVGYTAASGRFDLGAALLFLMLLSWQLPHFLSIAIRRHDDYSAAKIPVLPVVRGVPAAKINAVVYIILFDIFAALLAVRGYAGMLYISAVIIFGISWFILALKGFAVEDETRWGRTMFLFSLLTLMAILGAIIVEGIVRIFF